MNNYIWITAEKEFIHNYPDAPKEVLYLRDLHRHMFKFKVYLEIFSKDRDVEFIMFKHFVQDCLKKLPYNLENTSCEMLANKLNVEIKKKYGYRNTMIEVSEDGENGVMKQYNDAFEYFINMNTVKK